MFQPALSLTGDVLAWAPSNSGPSPVGTSNPQVERLRALLHASKNAAGTSDRGTGAARHGAADTPGREVEVVVADVSVPEVTEVSVVGAAVAEVPSGTEEVGEEVPGSLSSPPAVTASAMAASPTVARVATTIPLRTTTMVPAGRPRPPGSIRLLAGHAPSSRPGRLVQFEDIQAAQRLVGPVLRRTPVESAEHLSGLAGRPLLLKAEYRQRTGSFKIRGAYHRLCRLTDEQRAAGVVAASAGNHAQGVALAASLVEVSATIFMPVTAPLPKVAATRSYGAEVILSGTVFDDALEAALDHAGRTGAVFVSPFDDIDIIAGQGTLGLELADQAPEAAMFVVSVGGGGLISGVAAACKALRPDCRVIGVEAEGAASMTAALAAGHPVTLARLETMADGIANKTVSDLTLAHVQALVDEVVTVGEEDLSRALLLLLERAKAVVEPAGAAPLAAVLAGRVPDPGGEPTCLVLSGGNVDPTLLVRVIRHGLTAAGRYLVLGVALHDRPGELHRLTGALAEMGLNVLGVEHHRSGVDLPFDEVGVQLTLETRDPSHRDEVVQAVEAAGFRIWRG